MIYANNSIPLLKITQLKIAAFYMQTPKKNVLDSQKNFL